MNDESTDNCDCVGDMVFVRSATTGKNLHTRRVPSELRALIDAMMPSPRPSRRGERGARASAVPPSPRVRFRARAFRPRLGNSSARTARFLRRSSPRSARGSTWAARTPPLRTSTASRIPRGPARRSMKSFPAPDAMYYFDREGWPNGVSKEWCEMSAPGAAWSLAPSRCRAPSSARSLHRSVLHESVVQHDTRNVCGDEMDLSDTIDPNVFWHRTKLHEHPKQAWWPWTRLCTATNPSTSSTTWTRVTMEPPQLRDSFRASS